MVYISVNITRNQLFIYGLEDHSAEHSEFIIADIIIVLAQAYPNR